MTGPGQAPIREADKSMRFEVGAAVAIGILLPALETLRRGMDAWAVDSRPCFEDYVAGALLLNWRLGSTPKRCGRALPRRCLVVRHRYDEQQFYGPAGRDVRGTVTEPAVCSWSRSDYGERAFSR